jgi:hypothetical protein
MLKSSPWMRPTTFLNSFVFNTLSSEAKQLRNALERVLRLDFNIQNPSLKLTFFLTGLNCPKSPMRRSHEKFGL